MESTKVCMNTQCGVALASGEWKKGWPMLSGDLASLCDKCGTAYEQSSFCEAFHTGEPGWSNCKRCGKALHSGCIASRFMMEFLDSGGITCISCPKKSSQFFMNVSQESNGRDLPSFASAEHVGSVLERTNLKDLPHIQRISPTQSSLRMEQEESLLPSRLDALRDKTERKELQKLSAQPNLSISLEPTLVASPSHDAVVDGRSKTTSIFQQVPRSRQLLLEPANSAPTAAGMEPNESMVSQIHVARPPPEGRGKTKLLPRYWPRTTDEELQQLSKQCPHLFSNSKIIPLFEKVLSASDAGRIGRLVLPKCAEAYFPSISQPEGIPLKIYDIEGKEWGFQFRFWPNNNSRMYFLKGVTPCIQSMQLQAGDTVTFSRTEPEEKLVMGYRKATKSTATQMFKGSSESNLNMVSNNLNPGCGDINRSNLEKSEDMGKDNLFLQSSLTSARKRVRNIGTNSKRLLIDSFDVLELQIDWDDEQKMMRPPEYVKPSIFTVEDQDFEEYDGIPVFGKKTVFVSRQKGEVEQLVQCDACGKWRRLSVDTLIPQKWSCSDNLLDPARKMRSSCSAPDELSPREQDKLVRQIKEFKRRKLASSIEKLNQTQEASAVVVLANAGISTTGEQGEIAVAATTKHTRHRTGCSCIVCSQLPNRKGKQKQACTCTVCDAAWRRFKQKLMEWKFENRHETGVESIPADEPAAGGNIDLNTDPGASGMNLLQVALFPEEAHLKQKVISNTAAEQQSSDMVGTEQGSSSAAQAQDKDTSGAHEPVS